MKFLTFFEVQKENNYLLFIFAFTNYIIHTLCNSWNILAKKNQKNCIVLYCNLTHNKCLYVQCLNLNIFWNILYLKGIRSIFIAAFAAVGTFKSNQLIQNLSLHSALKGDLPHFFLLFKIFLKVEHFWSRVVLVCGWHLHSMYLVVEFFKKTT